MLRSAAIPVMPRRWAGHADGGKWLMCFGLGLADVARSDINGSFTGLKWTTNFGYRPAWTAQPDAALCCSISNMGENQVEETRAGFIVFACLSAAGRKARFWAQLE
jgi:hypothetical protein